MIRLMTNAIKNLDLRAVSDSWSAKVDRLCELAQRMKDAEVEVPVEHHLHAGVYSRTILHKKGVICIGCSIHIPTQLIISGNVDIYTEGGVVHVEGYKVLDGEKGRRVVVYAHEDTWATMLFSTNAMTVEEAEREFAGDSFEKLSNHRGV